MRIPATELRDMQTRNDEWIARIRDLEAEMAAFQVTPVQTAEVKLALRSLTLARLWLQEDKTNLGGVAHREALPS